MLFYLTFVLKNKKEQDKTVKKIKLSHKELMDLKFSQHTVLIHISSEITDSLRVGGNWKTTLEELDKVKN